MAAHRTSLARNRTLAVFTAAGLLAATVSGCGSDGKASEAVGASTTASALPSTADHGDCLTSLGAPSAQLTSTAPADASFRELFVSKGAAAFRDEDDSLSQLLTASGASTMQGTPWASATEGFVVSTREDKFRLGALALVGTDGSQIWASPEVDRADEDTLAVPGDRVLVRTYPSDDGTVPANLVSLSAQTGEAAAPPESLTAESLTGHYYDNQVLAWAPTSLVATKSADDPEYRSQFLDTVTGKTMTPAEGWEAETASGSSLLVLSPRNDDQRAVMTPDGMSAPWPAAEDSAAGLCGDVLYTLVGSTLTVSTVAEPGKPLATASVAGAETTRIGQVLAAPGAVAVLTETSGDNGIGSTATVTLYTQ